MHLCIATHCPHAGHEHAQPPAGGGGPEAEGGCARRGGVRPHRGRRQDGGRGAGGACVLDSCFARQRTAAHPARGGSGGLVGGAGREVRTPSLMAGNPVLPAWSPCATFAMPHPPSAGV